MHYLATIIAFFTMLFTGPTQAPVELPQPVAEETPQTITITKSPTQIAIHSVPTAFVSTPEQPTSTDATDTVIVLPATGGEPDPVSPINQPVAQPTVDHTEILVHDDTQYTNNWPDNPNGRDFHVFLKDKDGNNIHDTTTAIEFYVNGELVATQYPNLKTLKDFSKAISDPEFMYGTDFSREYAPGDTLTIKSLGLEKVINI